MPPHVTESTLILRRWEHGQGLNEAQQPIRTLDELYAACLAVDSPYVVDRVVIRGQDEAGEPYVVLFAFLSVTTGTASE